MVTPQMATPQEAEEEQKEVPASQFEEMKLPPIAQAKMNNADIDSEALAK